MQTILKTALYAALAFLVTAGNGEAQTGRLPGPKLAPGQVVEMIAPAATVLSTSHYQAELQLFCSGGGCTGDFPKPGFKRQLNITRMSCILGGTSGSTFTSSFITLRSSTGAFLLHQDLPIDFSSSDGVHMLNRAVDMQVGGSQHITASHFLASGTANSSKCTATGILSVLQ